MNTTKKTILTGLSILALSATTAHAAKDGLVDNYKDGAHVTVSGTVSNLTEDHFTINHAGKAVKVEYDDWKDGAVEDLRAYLTNGEKVVVSGEVDKDWFSANELEADNIFFQQKQSYFYIVDTNPAYYYDTEGTQSPRDGSYVMTRGTVKTLDGDDFIVSSNGMEYRIETSALAVNPVTAKDGLTLKKGDRIYVNGEVDDNFFGKKEIEADTVIKINRVGAS